MKTNNGVEFIVDKEDEEELSSYKWHSHKTNTKIYIRGYKGKRSEAKLVYLHRVITSAYKGFDVDHINGDTLDNRKSNLRVCSRGQNSANKIIKGFYKHGNKYVVSIEKDGKRIRKRYYNISDAMKEHKKLHTSIHGEYSYYNRETIT